MSSHIILDDIRRSAEDEGVVFTRRAFPSVHTPTADTQSTSSSVFVGSVDADCSGSSRLERDEGRSGYELEALSGLEQFHDALFTADVKDCDQLTSFSDNPGATINNGLHKTDMPGHDPIPKESCGNDSEKEPSSTEKHSQIAITLKWLTDNYERVDGVCLPRCVLYSHYLDLCKRKNFTPAGAATFGKLIRQRFPKLTTRRLGTRGQSKYHYYGIGIKESSVYYHSVYTGKGLTRFSGTKVKTEGSSRKFSLGAKTGTLLPEFIDVKDILLPESMDKDKVETFLMMYRTHCQRILDTVISANFDEIQNFLLHFWQGMPEHLVALLSYDVTADIISLCDMILYRVMLDVLIPSTIQDLPESLCCQMRSFAAKLPIWMKRSLEGIPESIVTNKTESVAIFVRCLGRQMSFIHLAQTLRLVLNNAELVSNMVRDIEMVDFHKIVQEVGCADPSSNKDILKHGSEYFHQLKSLLNKQAPIESITEWLDDVIDTCVIQASKDGDRQRRAAQFLLRWTIFESLIIRDLTLGHVSTYASIHLLSVMLDEYIFLVMDTYNQQMKERQVETAVQRYLRKTGGTTNSNHKLGKYRHSSFVTNIKKRKHEESNRKQQEAGSFVQSQPTNGEQVNDSGSSPHSNTLTCLQESYLSSSKIIMYGRMDGSELAQQETSLIKQPSAQVSSMDHSYLSQHEPGASIQKPVRRSGMACDVQIPNGGCLPRLGCALPSAPFGSGSLNFTPNTSSTQYWAAGTYPDGYSGCYYSGACLNNYEGHSRQMALLRVDPEGYQRMSALDPTVLPPQYDLPMAAGYDTGSFYNAHQDNYNGALVGYSTLSRSGPQVGQYGSQDTLYQSQYDPYRRTLTPFGHSLSKSLMLPFR